MRASVACVRDKFPELMMQITRSPRFSKMRILLRIVMLSMPALVRESDRKTAPCSHSIPRQ